MPDGELPVHPTSKEEAELAARAGLAYRHVPTTKASAVATASTVAAAATAVEGESRRAGRCRGGDANRKEAPGANCHETVNR